MRKLIAIPITLFLAFFMTACTKKVEILHEVTAPYGRIVGDKNTGYKLIVKEMDARVIWFSSRPERKAGYVPIKVFLQNWDDHRDNFQKDPPNAIIIIGNNEPLIVEMILLDWNEKRAVFKLEDLKGQESKISDTGGPISIFIDDVTINELYFNPHEYG